MNKEESLKTKFLNTIQIVPRRLGHNKLQIEMEELKNELDKWKTISEQKDENLKSLTMALSKIQLDSEKKSKHLNILESSLNKELDKEHEALIKQLENEISEMKNENSILNSQITNLTTIIDNKSNDINRLQAKINSQQSEITLVSENFNTLKEEYNKNIIQLNDTQNENLTMKTELQLKNDLFNQLKEEFDLLKTDYIKIKSESTNNSVVKDNIISTPVSTDNNTSIVNNDNIENKVLTRKEMRLKRRR